MEPRGYQYPRLSPDGRRVALDLRDRLNDVWYWDLDRSTLTKVTSGRRTGGPALWSSDGRAVIYGQNVDGAINLHMQDVDGGSSRLLLTGPNTQVANDVTPDGRSLVFADYDSAEGVNLRMLHVGQGEASDLMRTPANEHNSDVSPDGRWIAYNSAESGRSEVYVSPVPYDGKRWQLSNAGGAQPTWRADGREIYYLSPEGALNAVEVQAAAGRIDASTPRRLFRTSLPVISTVIEQYRPAADGQRFLFCLPVTAVRSEPLRVLLNWPARLSARS
jgi:Tol biopolymer transport system component